MHSVATATILTICAAGASAQIFETFESFDEGVLGDSFVHAGIAFHDANNVSGQYPDGTPFGPDELGSDFIIEQADLFYNDFPAYGSPVNSLTFGRSYVPGENLSIGPLASIWMSLDAVATNASLDIAFYENGPWGGIEYRLDALRDGTIVASDAFVISDLGGRDNPTFDTLAVDSAPFDQLHLYATINGQYTAPRGMIDDIVITPAPAAPFALLLAGTLHARRRR